MYLMYSLQIFVKLVPFITAHNSNILSHIEGYLLYPQFQIVQWPPSLARAGRNVSQVLLISTRGLLVPLMMLLFLWPPTREPGWAFDNILTSMHASEAFSTTNKNHMHTKDGAWEGRKLVTQSFGLSDETCVLQACTSPPKTCYIQPALTFYCKYYCGPGRRK